MPRTLRIRSHAKVNLGLEVLGLREDGYHELRTLFQTIDLHDLLDQGRNQRDGQIAMGDGAALRHFLCRPFGIDMNPLVIVSRISKLVDALLINHDPVRHADLFAFE